MTKLFSENKPEDGAGVKELPEVLRTRMATVDEIDIEKATKEFLARGKRIKKLIGRKNPDVLIKGKNSKGYVNHMKYHNDGDYVAGISH